MDALHGETPAAAETPPNEADRSARAGRLLGHIRKALSHDLPNQLVAVQGLLQVLQLEERQRLSADGQDYVRRAVAAAQRAQALVGNLKELARLGGERRLGEAVGLTELTAELGAEVQKLHPGCGLDCRLDPGADRVAAPRRLLHDGLLRLLRGLLDGAAARRLRIRSRRVPAGVELTVADLPRGGRPPARSDGDRLEWVLVEETLGECGGSLSVRAEAGGDVLALVLPAPE
jgi:signal transduction histidine kinase